MALSTAERNRWVSMLEDQRERVAEDATSATQREGIIAARLAGVSLWDVMCASGESGPRIQGMFGGNDPDAPFQCSLFANVDF